MSATDQPPAGRKRCGAWMPRKRDYCARKLNHKGDCRTAEALADERKRATNRRLGTRRRDDPAARARWNRAEKFNRLGITEARFHQMLEEQDYACGICKELFTPGQRICIDHDHKCCPVPPNGRTRSCGKCVRGLLCVRCNTWLGWMDKYWGAAQVYLVSAPLGTAGGLVELPRCRAIGPVEGRPPHTRKVAGSNPASPTTKGPAPCGDRAFPVAGR